MSDLAKNNKKKLNSRVIVSCGMLSACAIILSYLEIPLFFTPWFMKLHVSDLPALIGAFTLGPVAGVVIEFLKSLIMFIFNPYNPSMGIGELSNFILGSAFVVPAAIIYRRKKTKTRALVALIVSGLFMSVLGAVLNAFAFIPMYTLLMPIDQIFDAVPIEFVDTVFEFCLICVLPLNLLKAFVVSAITMFIYKPLSMLIKGITNY